VGLSALLAAFALACGGGGGKTGNSGSSDGGEDWDQQWIGAVGLNTNAAGDSAYDDYPQATGDGNGNWVVTWSSTDDPGGTIETNYDILVVRSTDSGTSWTKPEPLNTNEASDLGEDDRPRVATDGAGDRVAVWRSYDTLGGTIGTDSEILVARH
jgi:hypothetical protein